jgi:hypothetical protein
MDTVSVSPPQGRLCIIELVKNSSTKIMKLYIFGHFFNVYQLITARQSDPKKSYTV